MSRRPKILVAGIFVMDLIASTKVVPNSGETVLGMRLQTVPGGKGANQAVQAARLGADVTMVGRVGDDVFGRAVVSAAAEAGVDVSHVTVDPDEPTGASSITLEVTETSANNRIIVCPGANHTITLDQLAWLRDEIGNYDMVLLQFELEMFVNEAIAALAHEAGVPVMVNPAPAAPIPDGLLRCTTYLSPNEHEAAAIAGHPLRVEAGSINAGDLHAVTDYFHGKGVEKLIITLGENGSVASGKDGTIHVGSVHMPHVEDTTAAGDSFIASFCTGLCAGLPEQQALTFASHVAAITVSRMGAIPSLPTADEVTALMRERRVTDFDYEKLSVLGGTR